MENTLLILGAGASKDFCRIFPTGLELIKDINYHFLTEHKYPEAHESDGIYLSALMNDIVRTFGNKVDLFKKIKNRLWDIQLKYEWESLRNKQDNPVSIDHFIADKIRNGELEPIASEIIKYAIYYLIKGTEQAFSEGDYSPADSWIGELAKKLSTYDFETIKNNLTVVTFNYDRTFEKYFTESLSQHMSLSLQIDDLQNNVLHVYGSLGNLKEIPFKLENERYEIISRHFCKIMLIDERSETTLGIPNVDKFKKIHFIGFGYDKTNMSLIDLKRFASATFHGTAYYYTEEQKAFLKTEYNIDAKDICCKDYIQNMII